MLKKKIINNTGKSAQQDEALLLAYAQGDTNAFETLYSRIKSHYLIIFAASAVTRVSLKNLGTTYGWRLLNKPILLNQRHYLKRGFIELPIIALLTIGAKIVIRKTCY